MSWSEEDQDEHQDREVERVFVPGRVVRDQITTAFVPEAGGHEHRCADEERCDAGAETTRNQGASR